MHLIAKGVAKATGIRWIADFRDPWTEIFYFKHLNLSSWAYRKHRRLEQSVLDSADVVTVVSRKMQAYFAARTKTPVEVVTNGFDHEDFLCQAVETRKQTKPYAAERCFSLVHTGIFVDNGNPEYLWEALGEKAKEDPQFKGDLQITLMGQVDDSILQGIANAGLEGNLQNMGYRPHTEVVQWQQQAQVLLLPLRKEPEAAAILPANSLSIWQAAGIFWHLALWKGIWQRLCRRRGAAQLWISRIRRQPAGRLTAFTASSWKKGRQEIIGKKKLFPLL